MTYMFLFVRFAFDFSVQGVAMATSRGRVFTFGRNSDGQVRLSSSVHCVIPVWYYSFQRGNSLVVS
jgi:hypothetical protein